MSNGSSVTPIAERAWRPGSPQSSTMRSLKPLMTTGIALKPGAPRDADELEVERDVGRRRRRVRQPKSEQRQTLIDPRHVTDTIPVRRLRFTIALACALAFAASACA